MHGLTADSLAPDGQPVTFYDPYDYYYAYLNDVLDYDLPVRDPAAEHFYPVERTRQNNSFERYNGLARWSNDHFDVKYAFTRMKRYQPVDILKTGGMTADLPEYTYPLPAREPGDGYGIPHIGNPRKRQIQEQHDVALGWHDRFGELELSASLNMMDQTKKYRSLEFIGVNGLGRQWSEFRTRRYGGQLDLAYTLGEDWPISHYLELHVSGSQETMYADANFAVTVNAPESQREYYQRYRRHRLSFQGQDTITIAPLGDLEITPIVRVEKLFGPILGSSPNPLGPSDGDYDWLPTFSISAKKDFGDWTIFANSGTYNRYPNFYEIYGDGLNIDAGSTDLDGIAPLLREYGRNSDLGIGWNGTIAGDLRASFRAIGFIRNTKNTISYVPTPAGSKYINSGTTLTRGVELEGNLVLGDFADLQAAYTYQKGRYTEGTYYWFGLHTGRDKVGDNPLYTLNNPRQVASGRLNLHFLDGKLTTFVAGTYVGKRYTYQGVDGEGEPEFSYDLPLTTIDFGGHYKFDNGLNLSFGVNDAFNQGPKQRFYSVSEDHEHKWDPCGYPASACPVTYTPVNSNVGFPQQGRTFYFTVAKHFGSEYASDRKGGGAFDAADGSWTGFYVGGTVGTAWAPIHSNESLVFGSTPGAGSFDGVYDDMVEGGLTFDSLNSSLNNNAYYKGGFDGSGSALGTTRAAGIKPEKNDGASYGFRVGYDRQIGNWLVGGLLEWTDYGLTDAVSGYGELTLITDPDAPSIPEAIENFPESYAFTRKLNSVASLRLRGGYTFGKLLGYVTGGVARGDIEHGFQTTNTLNDFAENDAKDKRWGIQVGAGIEAQIGGPFTLGVEYLHTRFDDGDYNIYATGSIPDAFGGTGFQPGSRAYGTHIKRSSDAYEINSLRVTAGFRF